MKRIDEAIEEALLATEASIPEDAFCERVMARLPKAKRRAAGSGIRRLSLVAAACVGSVLTLLLGAPVEGLFAVYVEPSELMPTVLGAAVALGILVIPVVWLVYTESGEG